MTTRNLACISLIASGAMIALLLVGCARNDPATSPSAERPQGRQAARELSLDLGGGVKLEMVLISAGEFLMGSPDSDRAAPNDRRPQHRVRITKAFYIGKYEVTQEQWEAVMGNNPSSFKGPKNPVDTVSWDDCQQFLKKLNDKAPGGRWSLPTEAQWEYACRAGSNTLYCFGDGATGLGEYAWHDKNANGTTHAVGEKKPNAWGLYDMHGNVWEWCADWFDPGYYKESPVDDPPGPASDSFHVIRDGGWNDVAKDCQSATRNFNRPQYRGNNLGLRVCRVAAE